MRVSETKDIPDNVTREEEEMIISSVDAILASYRGEKAELIPVLQQVQQRLGYLPETALSRIAAFTNVPESTVFGVATFYAQFKLVPTGRNVVKVCRGTACHVRRGERILREVERQLDIKPGETTPDLEYSLETVACLGACALAPNMVINNKVYGKMVESKVKKILGNSGDHNEI
jgi:NADH-quinone oxidoreductase subunit E